MTGKLKGMECANHIPAMPPMYTPTVGGASLEVENSGVLKEIDVDC